MWFQHRAHLLSLHPTMMPPLILCLFTTYYWLTLNSLNSKLYWSGTTAGPSLRQDALSSSCLGPSDITYIFALVPALTVLLWLVRSPWVHLFVLWGLCLCPGCCDGYLMCYCAAWGVCLCVCVRARVCAWVHEYMQVPEFLCMSGHVKKVKTLTANVVSIIDKFSVGILRCLWKKPLLLYRMDRETKCWSSIPRNKLQRNKWRGSQKKLYENI